MADAISYSLKDLTERLGGDVQGDATIRVTQVASLAHAQPHQIAFLADLKYKEQLAHSAAAAFILVRNMGQITTKPCILVDNPYTYFRSWM